MRRLNYQLHPIVKKRLRVIFALCTVAILCGVLLLYSRNINLGIISSRLNQLDAEITKISTTITFGTYDNQTVDQFISNLNRQIKVFNLQKESYELILDRPELFSKQKTEQTIIKYQLVNKQLERYRLDRTYMAFAYLDYALFRLDPNFLIAYKNLTKQLVTYSFNQQQLLNNINNDVEPFYVYEGQIIGLQGCTGICTGTHLHFVTVIDGQVKDGCELLPKIDLSIWGVAGECGVEQGARLSWPVIIPWMLTQKFDTISPVLKNQHRALDILDRDLFPIRAAHSGWYYPAQRGCIGAVICNNGAANVATICESLDCNKGIKTEYWHLDWLAGFDQVSTQ